MKFGASDDCDGNRMENFLKITHNINNIILVSSVLIVRDVKPNVKLYDFDIFAAWLAVI